MAMSIRRANQYLIGTVQAGQRVFHYESGLTLSSKEPQGTSVFVSEEVISMLENALLASLLNIRRAIQTLHEILLLLHLQENWKEKLKVDFKSLIETPLPYKGEIIRYLRETLPQWLEREEVKEIKITTGTPEDGINPHIVIIAKFVDSEKALDVSEELEYQLLSADPRVSNRILVYSLFE